MRDVLERRVAYGFILYMGHCLKLSHSCFDKLSTLNLMAVYMWERLEKTISQLSTLNKIAGKLRRFVIGNAIGCEMDKQG